MEVKLVGFDQGPIILVCRVTPEQNELWGLTVAKDGARSFTYMGTTAEPQDFKHRVELT